MPIRITGMNSGLDTDSIVQELVSAYRKKTEKYEKAQTKLEWTQDAWKDMNSKIYGFYSKSLSNMRLEGNFSGKKKTTVSDNTKASIVADKSVVNGTQTLKVNKLATAGYLTGMKLELKDNKEVTRDTTLSELGLQAGKLKLKVGNEEKTVEIKADMKVSEFVDALKEQGVTASFDAKQQRFFLSSSGSGTDKDFEFVVDNEADLLQLKKLGLASAQNMAKVTTEKDMKEALAYQTMLEAGVTKALTVDVNGKEVLDTSGEDISYEKYMEKSEEEREKLWSAWETAFNAKTDEEKSNAEKAAKKELVRNFDGVAKPGEAGYILELYDDPKYNDSEYIEKRMKDLEKAYYNGLVNSDEVKNSCAVKTDAGNAEIELNGAKFESDTNEFTINGLNITATGKSDLMTITTATDVDGVYNMIKDFIKEYNELTKSMETAFNAKSSKGYEPLTDDEKSEMSDEEVEKWEKKIKDSLLRRDDTLSSVLSSMSMAMGKSYEIDGKSYTLASFGIKTAGYFNRVENESYAYHIDGDKDDSVSEGNEDKLKKMIAEDPELVEKFFTQLAKDVYGNLDAKMKSTTLSSSYTVYNDKQMKNEYDEYTETIKKWEEKLADIEDRYYKQFAAMETALSKLQSQTNSFASLLGG